MSCYQAADFKEADTQRAGYPKTAKRRVLAKESVGGGYDQASSSCDRTYHSSKGISPTVKVEPMVATFGNIEVSFHKPRVTYGKPKVETQEVKIDSLPLVLKEKEPVVSFNKAIYKSTPPIATQKGGTIKHGKPNVQVAQMGLNLCTQGRSKGGEECMTTKCTRSEQPLIESFEDNETRSNCSRD